MTLFVIRDSLRDSSSLVFLSRSHSLSLSLSSSFVTLFVIPVLSYFSLALTLSRSLSLRPSCDSSSFVTLFVILPLLFSLISLSLSLSLALSLFVLRETLRHLSQRVII